MSCSYDYDGNDSYEEELYDGTVDNAADLKFRSIQLLDRSNIFGNIKPLEDGLQIKDNNYFMIQKTHQQYPHLKSQHKPSCPLLSFGISKYQVIIDKINVDDVIASINICLALIDDFDFSFIEFEFMWRGKYLNGSNCCEVQLNLYYDRQNKNYVLAVRKMKTDNPLNGCFHQLYLKLSSELGYVDPNKSNAITPLNSPLRSPYSSFYCKDGVFNSKKATEQEFLEGIQPIFMMIKHKNSSIESRIQAAKMLCDVSGKNLCYLELESFRTECVSALKTLLDDDDADVRQYAVMATAAFAELPSYVKMLLHSSILVAIFELVESTPSPVEAYATAQVRRTAASLLATLCKSDPNTVKAELEKQHCDIEGWLKIVYTIEDLRTRESSISIRASLADIPSIDCSQHDGSNLSIDTDLMLSSSTHNLIL